MTQFHNEIELVVRSGETGEVLHKFNKENAISDDMLVGSGRLYNFAINIYLADGYPFLFLLPDGAAWSGFTWDRTNPWAPYCCTANRTGDQNPGVDQLWKAKTYTAPFDPGNPVNKHKLFYSWNALPHNLQLKAVGLTGFQDNTYGNGVYGAGPNFSDVPTIFNPQSLVILPSSILVHGREAVGGVPTQTPDILEVSYFLSVVGVG